MSESNDNETLPCGCKVGTDGAETLIFEPHALDCENYLFFVAEVARQGKAMTTIDLR